LGGIHWLDTTWKAEQEAAKKAGYIQSYEVLLANPQGPNDPDILLVITYKNWAALDGGLAKGDEIAKQVEGSVAKANQSEADRSKMRPFPEQLVISSQRDVMAYWNPEADPERTCFPAGQGVGAFREIKPAGEVLREIVTQAETILRTGVFARGAPTSAS